MNFKSTLLAAAATLIVAAPAMAQDATTQSAPAPQPAPGAAAPAAPAATPAQAAFQAEAEAFQQRVQPMESEIVAAVTAAGTDAAKAQADADAVIDRYAVEFTTFADKLDAFLDSEIAASTDQAAIAGMTQAKATAVPQLRGAPAMIKAQVAQQLAAFFMADTRRFRPNPRSRALHARFSAECKKSCCVRNPIPGQRRRYSGRSLPCG